MKRIRFHLSVAMYWIRYTPFFFSEAPVLDWWKYFRSARKVSVNTALWKLSINRHKDVWKRGAVRSAHFRRLRRWGANI